MASLCVSAASRPVACVVCRVVSRVCSGGGRRLVPLFVGPVGVGGVAAGGRRALIERLLQGRREGGQLEEALVARDPRRKLRLGFRRLGPGCRISLDRPRESQRIELLEPLLLVLSDQHSLYLSRMCVVEKEYLLQGVVAMVLALRAHPLVQLL